MKSNLIIFPVLFDESEFNSLEQIKDSLADLIIVLNACNQLKDKSQLIDLSRVVFDLKEIISHKNAKGYRWNSYILSLAILKIEYIISYIEAKCCESCCDILMQLNHNNILLRQILDYHFKEYQQEFV